ncbi:MAG: hypothetical protein KGD57_00395, partial [Candidatus Lokiarchaeota archaeon]|nr:hypothetical protein [Candidatus Lokiarchaeota archaeon]
MEKIENKINLSDSIDFLIEKLKHLTDIDLDYYNRKFLIKRIHFRMNNLNYSAYQAYFDYIISHPPEIDYFLDKFTINYTYFFRNFEVFEKLKSVIIDFKKK